MHRTARVLLIASFLLLLGCQTAFAIPHQKEQYKGERRAELIRAAEKIPDVEAELLRYDVDAVTSRVYKSPSGKNFLVQYRDEGKVFLEVALRGSDLELMGTETRKNVRLKKRVGQAGTIFGGKLLTSYPVWWTMTALFLLLLINPRAWRSWWTLDVLALASFGISHAFFVRGTLTESAVASFVPLLYLAVSLSVRALLGVSSGDSSPGTAVPWLLRRTRLLWTAVAGVFLFRWYVLISDGVVTDVGAGNYYGAERMLEGRLPYGTIGHGLLHADTYGLLSYALHIPGVGVANLVDAIHNLAHYDQVRLGAGLTAAGADLACALVLGLIAKRWIGRAWAPVAVLAWALYPDTLWSLSSAFNDPIVALLLALVLLFVARPLTRGALLAAAAAVKIGPIAAVGPILFVGSDQRLKSAVRTIVGGLLVIGACVIALALGHDGLSRFWKAVIDFELNRKRDLHRVEARDIPTMWEVYKLHLQHRMVQVVAVLTILALWVLPRQRTPRDVAVGIAATLALVQLAADHWWFNYLIWIYAPLVPLLVWHRASHVERS